MRRASRRVLVLALLVAAGATAYAALGRWRDRVPASARATLLLGPVRFADARLVEPSAAIVSRAQPGVLWTLNDSGNDPTLFAVDSAGRTLAAVAVDGARDVDWEAMARVPCGGGARTDCLIAADIGDNSRSRLPGHTRHPPMLYRVEEPRVAGAPDTATRHAPMVQLEVHYPDGAHNAEAMYATPAGDLYVIIKGEDARQYRLRAPAWGRDTLATLEPLAPVPVPAGEVVTDAALSPNGRHVAVRTYRWVRTFVAAADGSIPAGSRFADCAPRPLQKVGEGIDWLDDSTLVLTTEGTGVRGTGGLMEVRCPRP